MKTIGLIGGMSWESSLEYYRIVNEQVRNQLGGLHSAQTLMFSVDFAEIEAMQSAGQWDEAGKAMSDAGLRLQNGGADFIVLCTNTMHKLVPQIEAAVQIPLLHIADATAARIQAAGMQTVGLLGTRFTMEETFYRGRLEDKFGLRVLTPPPAQRELVHRVIYDELCLGVTRAESRHEYRAILHQLAQAGAQAIILGCTEIGLLVNQTDSPVPLFDTTRIHAEEAVRMALEA
jgi:aspartate racemase